MMEVEGDAAESCAVEGAATAPVQQQGKKPSKCRRRRRASGEGKQGRGGGHHGYRPPHRKKPVSSTRAANNIMRFRLGGSISDPLNLEGGGTLSDECSTCAPSPAAVPQNSEIAPPLLTPHLDKDPLNLEGKAKNFPLLGAGGGSGKAVTAAGQRRKPRRRTTSGSKPDTEAASCPKPLPKEGKFHYGNYNRYYGYRNGGVNELDPRLALLRKEWLEDRDCLDIGCNTGQVTIQLAKEKHPRKVLGIDIDQKLIKMAWKNLHRSYTPSFTPDGRPFPSSLTLSRGPVDFPPTLATSAGPGCTVAAQDRGSGSAPQTRPFPHNVQFMHCNYVPMDDSSVDAQTPEYDVILALSLSKWIHLNWGDIGIKRFFKKVYRHLRPGGKFILEPQPFSSYSRKKKLTEEIFKNYQNIHFRPRDFHNYLLSSEVGFSAHQNLGVPGNKSKGFQRPIHMYLKSADLAHPPDKHHSVSNPSLVSGRLKSVVVPCTNTQQTN